MPFKCCDRNINIDKDSYEKEHKVKLFQLLNKKCKFLEKEQLIHAIPNEIIPDTQIPLFEMILAI